MHELYNMKDADGNDDPIPTLYVKSAPYTYDIRQVFSRARALAPCMLILEDVETIVTPDTRSYFFNEMDGLENNDGKVHLCHSGAVSGLILLVHLGIFVVASTNFLNKLDPGLSKRPSRFDRKYNFPLPNENERTLYCEYWRNKLKSKKSIDFPEKLCPAMAHITQGFSFAFLQECFVATLLVLAREEIEIVAISADARPFDGDNDDLDDYKLWVTFKEQAEVLRKEVENQKGRSPQLTEWLKASGSLEDATPYTAASTGKSREHCQGCCHCQERASGRDIVRKRREDELLPKLPWYNQKREWVNSAAFELRP